MTGDRPPWRLPTAPRPDFKYHVLKNTLNSLISSRFLGVFHLFQSDWLHLMRPIAVEDIDQYLSDGRYLPTHVVYIFAIEVCANRAI